MAHHERTRPTLIYVLGLGSRKFGRRKCTKSTYCFVNICRFHIFTLQIAQKVKTLVASNVDIRVLSHHLPETRLKKKQFHPSSASELRYRSENRVWIKIALRFHPAWPAPHPIRNELLRAVLQVCFPHASQQWCNTSTTCSFLLHLSFLN